MRNLPRPTSTISRPGISSGKAARAAGRVQDALGFNLCEHGANYPARLISTRPR
jgi:hypothetical protein